MQTIVEDKTATGLLNAANKNPDGTLKSTEADWAKKNIFDKTKTRIDALQTANSTKKDPGYVGPATPPTVSDLQKITNYAFQVTGNWAVLQTSVQTEVQNLRAAYPNLTFSVTFAP